MYHSIRKWAKDEKRPQHEEKVIGYDELDKKEVRVSYRSDSNRFFEEPYTGAVFPLDRMYRWRPETNKQ